MSVPFDLPGIPGAVDRSAVVKEMLRRAAKPGFEAWWGQIESIGFCANPIHLTGINSEGRQTAIMTRCNNRRSSVCPSCSGLYARDTWQLIHAGLSGGHHDVPATVASHPQVFVTLTAPGFGTVHTVSNSGPCHPTTNGSERRCTHGRSLRCNVLHSNDDIKLGQPLCIDCYDYLSHVLFSWHAPELWRRFIIRLRRFLAAELKCRGEDPKRLRVSFLKVAEMQRRAVPHYHAIVRLDAVTKAGVPLTAPDTSLTASDLIPLVYQSARKTILKLPSHPGLRFGDQIDVKVVNGAKASEQFEGHSSRSVASYLAKYVTKSVAESDISTRRVSPCNIEVLKVSEHVRQILRMMVCLSQEDEQLKDLSEWLHTLGYRGHITSKSRHFSTTMTALRTRRSDWKRSQDGGQTIARPLEYDEETVWEFERAGHANLGERVLAVSASLRHQECRIAALQAIREGA
jgi:hypothetical protein